MRLIGSLLVALLLGACSASSSPSDAAPKLNKGTALVDTEDDTSLFYVLVAETDEQRAAAFETTTSLEDDEGMAFLYFRPTIAPFSSDTSLALSVAFFDGEGDVLDVVDLEPCAGSGQSCASYDPGVSYQGALIVNQGVFDRIGVDEAAMVEIVPGSE